MLRAGQQNTVRPGCLESEVFFFNWVSAHINNNVHIYLYIIQFHIIYISSYDLHPCLAKTDRSLRETHRLVFDHLIKN